MGQKVLNRMKVYMFYILNQDSSASLQLRFSVSKRKDFAKIRNHLQSSYLFCQNNH